MEEKKHLRITHFKTTGSKSYIYYYTDDDHPDGAFKLVLAGIPEDDFWYSYDKTHKTRDVKSVFKYFSKYCFKEFL